MKARTKEQIKLVEWSNSFPSLTERQMNYARRHVKFTDKPSAIESRGSLVCGECGHSWKDKSATASEHVKCPKCGKRIQILHNHTKASFKSYFSILGTKGGYQYIRWFIMNKSLSKEKITCSGTAVGTEWIDQRGKCISVELSRSYTFGRTVDSWIYDSEMELRRSNVFLTYLASSASLCQSITKTLRRNGWSNNATSQCYLYQYQSLVMSLLIQDSFFESMFKCGHYGACWNYVNSAAMRAGRGDMYDNAKLIIKLANRRHYAFDTKEKWHDHLDYVNDLRYCNQDIHNATLLFPDDFQKAHEYWNKRAQNKREREQTIQNELRDIETMNNKAKNMRVNEWLKKYEKNFSDLSISKGGFRVLPLITKDDFKAEMNFMHHCIATYYGKKDTLLLSIEHDGLKCETAEIDLKNRGNIIQCRSVHNQSSEYHDEIVQLLKDNMGEFVRRFKRKDDCKPIPTINVPVIASFYHNLHSVAI